MSKRLLIFCLLLFLILLPHLSFIYWPEMLSRPFLILHGWLPYRDFVMEHAPLLPVILAGWFRLFGLGFIQLQIFTWGIIAVTAVIINKYFSRFAAFIYLLLVFAYQGNGLWFDLALTPLLLICFILMEKKKYFPAGVVFVLAFFTKQTAIWLLPAFLYFLYQNHRTLKIFVSGIALAGILVVLMLASFGIFDEFLKWAVSIRAPAIWPTPAQFIYAFSPFIVLFLPSTVNSKLLTKIKMMAILSALGVFPRWELLHFQPALPYLAILLAGFFILPNKNLTKSLLTIILCGFLIRQYAQIINQPDRFREPEFLQTLNYVKNNTGELDRIFVLNTWESLYALSHCLPASRPLYPYLPWYLDLPSVQESVISNLVFSQPKLIIVGETELSGLGSYLPRQLNSYLEQNYRKTAKIGSNYVWEK